MHAHLDIGHITQSQQIVAIATDNKPTEFGNRRQPALGADREVTGGGLHRPRGQLHIVRPQRFFHVRHGNVVGRQPLAVQPDPDGVAALAADPHVRHAVQYRQPVGQYPIGKIAELGAVPDITGQRDPHHRAGIRVGLADDRRVRLVRQFIQDSRYRIAHVVGGHVDIAAGAEFNGCARLTLFGAGFDGANAFDTADRPFNHLGDLGINHFRRRADIIR